MRPDLYLNSSRRNVIDGYYDIINEKFGSLKDAAVFAKLTRVALRECNWQVHEHRFLTKVRIPLKTMFDMGLFSDKISKDNLGEYYHWKD